MATARRTEPRVAAAKARVDPLQPLQAQPPLFPAEALSRQQTPFSPGNPVWSARGDLFASVQTFGAKGSETAAHLTKRNPQSGRMEPYPNEAYQQRIGGLLGIRAIPKPAALGGDGTRAGGELLVGLDWKKSEIFALDLDGDQEVFRARLPEPFAQKLLSPLVPKVDGALSFHNDLDVTPAGRFVISNPSRGSIGVLEPDWSRPERSKFNEVLKGHRSTGKGKTPIKDVRGRPVSIKAFELFGRSVNLPFRAGVDSIAVTSRLGDKGAHILFSPLTSDGGAKLWAMPAGAVDAEGVRSAVNEAARQETLRPIARVPVNDGMRVVEVAGRPLLFGTDVQGGGAFVMDLRTLKAAPLVRDAARVGWADGMAVQQLGADRLRVTFANSGLESSLRGEDAPKRQRGLYSITIGARELLQRLDEQGVDVSL